MLTGFRVGDIPCTTFSFQLSSQTVEHLFRLLQPRSPRTLCVRKISQTAVLEAPCSTSGALGETFRALHVHWNHEPWGGSPRKLSELKTPVWRPQRSLRTTSLLESTSLEGPAATTRRPPRDYPETTTTPAARRDHHDTGRALREHQQLITKPPATMRAGRGHQERTKRPPRDHQRERRRPQDSIRRPRLCIPPKYWRMEHHAPQWFPPKHWGFKNSREHHEFAFLRVLVLEDHYESAFTQVLPHWNFCFPALAAKSRGTP